MWWLRLAERGQKDEDTVSGFKSPLLMILGALACRCGLNDLLGAAGLGRSCSHRLWFLLFL